MRLFFVLLCLSSSLLADTNSDIARCAAETNGVKRLDCFDGLSKRLGLVSPTTTTSKVSKWDVRKDTSKIDDGINVTISLQADTSVSGWPSKTFTPSLVLRCKEKKTEAYIVTGMAAQVEAGNYNGATITLRFDKEPAKKYLTSEATDKEALFFGQATSLIKKLMQHSTLLFEFVPFNSSPVMTTFDIQGLAEAVKPLREVCKW
jgi:type VI secretion system protein VasI